MLLEVAITFKPQKNQKPKKYYDVKCYKVVVISEFDLKSFLKKNWVLQKSSQS